MAHFEEEWRRVMNTYYYGYRGEPGVGPVNNPAPVPVLVTRFTRQEQLVLAQGILPHAKGTDAVEVGQHQPHQRAPGAPGPVRPGTLGGRRLGQVNGRHGNLGLPPTPAGEPLPHDRRAAALNRPLERQPAYPHRIHVTQGHSHHLTGARHDLGGIDPLGHIGHGDNLAPFGPDARSGLRAGP
ncbi:hypothetical protein ES703_118111 [subsurface metagenome]